MYSVPQPTSRGLSAGLVQPCPFTSQAAVPRPEEVIDSDRSYDEFSQGSDYVFQHLASSLFPLTPPPSGELQSEQKLCVHADGPRRDGCSDFCHLCCSTGMGWDRTGGALRAPMGPNDPEQPHLGPPPTASAPFKSNAGKAEGAHLQPCLKLCLGVVHCVP